jgi:hypothetical protein
MLDTDALLEKLDEKKIRNIDIARVLGLPDSRVPEIKQRTRALKLDEAARLVQAFELEPDRGATPLPPSVLRLVVQYVAVRMGVPEGRIHGLSDEVTEDLRAFSEFVSDPKVRRSIEAAEGFFRAMLLRRPDAESEAQPGTDPERTY